MPKENGKLYNLKTIAASLRRQGLVAKAARKFKATTNSKHNLPVFDNPAATRFFGECAESEVGRRHYLLVDR